MQVVLGSGVKDAVFFGEFFNIALGYGLAVMSGILVSGGVRDGHTYATYKCIYTNTHIHTFSNSRSNMFIFVHSMLICFS